MNGLNCCNLSEKKACNWTVNSIDKLFRIAIIIYIFCVFFAYSSGDIIVRISRLLIFGVWFLYLITSLEKSLKIRFYYIWGGVFLLYHFGLAYFGAIDRKYAIDFSLSTFYTFIVNAIILSYLIRKPVFFKTILLTISICAVLGGVRVFLTFGFDYYFNSRDGEVNANSIGANCAIGVLCALYLFVKNKRATRERFLILFLIFLNLVLSVLTASRKVYVFMGVPVVIYIIFSSKNVLKVVKNIAIAVLIVLLGYLLLMKVDFLYNLVGYRIESMISGFMGETTDASTSTRLGLIDLGIAWFTENPIWGYGLSGFKVLNNYGYYAHNNFIEMLVDGGIIGFILYYSLYLLVIVEGLKAFRKRDKTGIYFWGILIGLLICEYGMITYYITTIQMLIMLCYFMVCIRGKNNIYSK